MIVEKCCNIVDYKGLGLYLIYIIYYINNK